jgi:Tfp pilus assembly protein PilF
VKPDVRRSCGALVLTAVLLFAGTRYADAEDARLTAADKLFAQKEYVAALGAYSAILRATPNSAPAKRQAGACHVMIGESAQKDRKLAEFKQAEALLRDAVRLAPKDASAHYWLARALGQEAVYVGVWKSVSLGREVKREVDIALKLDPNNDSAYHIRARWHREVTEKPKLARIPLGLGDANLDEGLKDIRKALEINPHHLNHHIEMARYDIRLKKPNEAREELTQALADSAMDDPEYRDEAQALLATLTNR